MIESAKTSAKGRAVFRWFFAAAFVFAVAASGLFTGLMNTAGLFYLVFGTRPAMLRKQRGWASRLTSGRLPRATPGSLEAWAALSTS